jgi:hypothetical protein
MMVRLPPNRQAPRWQRTSPLSPHPMDWLKTGVKRHYGLRATLSWHESERSRSRRLERSPIFMTTEACSSTSTTTKTMTNQRGVALQPHHERESHNGLNNV